MYKIGDFSRLSGVSVKALRFYDHEGILKPEYIDAFTGYRYYSSVQLNDIHRVIALKDMGFSLQEIKELDQDVVKILNAKEAELNEMLRQVKVQLNKLNSVKEMMLMDYEKTFHVVIQKQEKCRTASIRKLFSNQNAVMQEIRGLREQLIKDGVELHNESIVINYETELAFDEDADMEVCIPFWGNLSKCSMYGLRELTFEDDIASVVCGKEDLLKAYSALQLYLQKNSCQIVGPFYEIYHEEDAVEIKVPVCCLSETSKEPRNDELNIPFENDPTVVGYWKVIDILPAKECFNPDRLKLSEESNHIQIKELYFLPNGEEYWCFSWTKGYLKSHYGCSDQKGLNVYEIFKRNGKTYMFVEMKLSEYFMKNGKPEIYVLEQLDNMPHTKDEVRIIELTDDVFVSDNVIIGGWKVCDFVEIKDDFIPGEPNPVFSENTLFFRKINFRDEGGCDLEYGDGKSYSEPHYTWTKGKILAHISKLYEAYEVRRVEGCDYLFVEWKSGDYTFGREEPWWYVFRREKQGKKYHIE